MQALEPTLARVLRVMRSRNPKAQRIGLRLFLLLASRTPDKIVRLHTQSTGELEEHREGGRVAARLQPAQMRSAQETYISELLLGPPPLLAEFANYLAERLLRAHALTLPLTGALAGQARMGRIDGACL
jgi:hypothetical protein